MEIKLNLSRLTESEIEKLFQFERTCKVDINKLIEELVETRLRALLQITDEDVEKCPSCYLQGVTSQLKSMPILMAEKAGWISIEQGVDRKSLVNMHYAICCRCLWGGLSDK